MSLVKACPPLTENAEKFLSAGEHPRDRRRRQPTCVQLRRVTPDRGRRKRGEIDPVGGRQHVELRQVTRVGRARVVGQPAQRGQLMQERGDQRAVCALRADR